VLQFPTASRIAARAARVELSAGALLARSTRCPQDTGLALRSNGYGAVDMERIILRQLTGNRNLVTECAVWVSGILSYGSRARDWDLR
jgi:hypothetical protein